MHVTGSGSAVYHHQGSNQIAFDQNIEQRSRYEYFPQVEIGYEDRYGLFKHLSLGHPWTPKKHSENSKYYFQVPFLLSNQTFEQQNVIGRLKRTVRSI